MGKHHSQEYKQYVSKLIVEEGRKATEVAYELEISAKTISRWVAPCLHALQLKALRNPARRPTRYFSFYSPASYINSSVMTMITTHFVP